MVLLGRLFKKTSSCPHPAAALLVAGAPLRLAGEQPPSCVPACFTTRWGCLSVPPTGSEARRENSCCPEVKGGIYQVMSGTLTFAPGGM